MALPQDILMIEDSATDAELAQRAFQRAKIVNPFKVMASGEEALAYLRGTGAYAKRGPTRPLLILLDLQLTRMSGLDFLREIKGEVSTGDIPVVTLSMTRSAPAIVMCIKLGVEQHIIKPVDFKALVRVTKKLKLPLTLASTEPPDDAAAVPGGKAA